MSSLFGLSNGYEQVGETPAPFQPPGTKKSNPLDLAAMKEGIASAAQGLAKQVGVEGIKKQDKLPEHLRPLHDVGPKAWRALRGERERVSERFSEHLPSWPRPRWGGGPS